MIEKIIDSKNSNQRIDKYVRKLLPGASLSFIYKVFRNKDVKINKHWVNISYILQENDLFQIYINDKQYEEFSNQTSFNKEYKFNHEIVFEDENILIINKPSGLLVHGDDKNKKSTLANDVLNYLYSKGEYNPKDSFTPGPAHRIDRNTSGLVIFGKKVEVLQGLLELFKDKKNLRKEYLALVIGITKDEETINFPLEKDEKNNTVFVSHSNKAKEAITKYKTIKRYKNMSLCSIEILTGRTHQIRVHMSYIGHPVAGDRKYGDFSINKKLEKQFDLSSQLLHAYIIEFKDVPGKLSYLSNRKFEAKLPNKFSKILVSIE